MMPSPKDAIRFGCPLDQKDRKPSQNEGYLESMERGVQSIACGNSINEIQDQLTSMAEQSANEVKNNIGSFTSAATDALGDVAGQMHAKVAGEDTLQMEEEFNKGQDNVPEADDAKRVDNMDSGKVEDFLRDRHKSSAAMRRTE